MTFLRRHGASSIASWLYMQLFLSALGAQANLYIEYPRAASLDPFVCCYAVSFWSASVRLADFVVPYTPVGAGLYITPHA